jgi:hypothetical protein
MPRVDCFTKSLTECFDDPLDRIAGAVIALAVFDATNDRRRKTIRNNSRHAVNFKNRRISARLWLVNHGARWMEALGIEPDPIMEVIRDN